MFGPARRAKYIATALAFGALVCGVSCRPRDAQPVPPAAAPSRGLSGPHAPLPDGSGTSSRFGGGRCSGLRAEPSTLQRLLHSVRSFAGPHPTEACRAGRGMLSLFPLPPPPRAASPVRTHLFRTADRRGRARGRRQGEQAEHPAAGTTRFGRGLSLDPRRTPAGPRRRAPARRRTGRGRHPRNFRSARGRTAVNRQQRQARPPARFGKGRLHLPDPSGRGACGPESWPNS
jgi:hypothetical protein